LRTRGGESVFFYLVTQFPIEHFASYSYASFFVQPSSITLDV
jgi:hypothetical protein